jgi:protein ImuA
VGVGQRRGVRRGFGEQPEYCINKQPTVSMTAGLLPSARPFPCFPMPAVPASASNRISAATLAQFGKSGAMLWQGDQLATPALPACASGFPPLDAELPGGGWPASGLTELMLHEAGSGEVRLLAPALARLAAGSRELVWIAPPYPPYAPALDALGLPLARLVWVQPAGAADAAWAAEQVLRSGAAGAVLWWSHEALPATLRRLHLAALEGSTPLFALRPWACRHPSSPAPLRLGIEPLEGAHLQVHLFKRRGPSLAGPLRLALPHPAVPPAQEGQQSAPAGRERPIAPSSPVAEDVVAGLVPASAAA